MCYMQNKWDFCKLLTSFYVYTFVCIGFVLFSCKDAKRAEDEAWVESVLEDSDSVLQDSLVYDVVDVPLSDAVDENFNDFLYAFLYNTNFQSARISLPVSVSSCDGKGDMVLKRFSDFHDLLSSVDQSYYVLILNNLDELESDPSSFATHSAVNLVNLQEGSVNRLVCSREKGEWNVSSIRSFSFDSAESCDFLHFYQQFALDSLYRQSHLSQPIGISMVDDDGEVIEGTIDPDQFSVFSPELPFGNFILLEYGDAGMASGSMVPMLPNIVGKCVMVKCGMASSMMDVLCFERDGSEWVLTRLEE